MILVRKTLSELNKSIGLGIENKDMLDIEIDKIYLNTVDKNLKIILKSKHIINQSDLDLMKKKFHEKFDKFNKVVLKIKYDISISNIETIINEYLENIKYLIKNEIPSSTVWIDDIYFKVNKNSITFLISNEISILNLNKRSLNTIIEEKLMEELNLRLNVRFEFDKKQDSSIENHEEMKGKEENKIIKKLKENINFNKDTKSLKPQGKDKAISLKSDMLYGSKIQGELIKISEIDINSGMATIDGEIFDIETRDIRGDRKLYTLNITDYSSSISMKIFANEKSQEILDENLKEGSYVRAYGDVVYDNYSRQIVIMIKGLQKIKKHQREDLAEEKRVELHCHTKMSSMDGMNSFTELAKRASEWGHKAIAITDHGIVQAFPEAMEASKKYNIKVLYGVEGYLLNDTKSIITNCKKSNLKDIEYTVFDIETTGLSNKKDSITEIGAVKVINGEIVDTYSQLINPKVNIPEKIVELTGITDDMVKNMPTIDKVIKEFIDFVGETVLVAHNASFDIGFIRNACNKFDIDLTNPILDTLSLSKLLFPELKSHKLNNICKHLNISLENHHRASDDAKATAEILINCLNILDEKEIYDTEELNIYSSKNINYKSEQTYHIIIFAKNKKGLKSLYKIISESHLNYFYRRPRILKSLLYKYKEDLLIGSACEAGELYKSILDNKEESEVMDIASFYDFLEIQSVYNNEFLIRNETVKDFHDLRNINKKIVDLGDKLNKPVVATGDVHFLDPQDEAYRRILMGGQGFNDADNQAPLYFKTTDEMLKEFSYLGERKAREVVVDNTNAIADMIDELKPIPDGTFPPVIEGADEDLKKMNYEKAKSIYGDPLPELVQKRLDREINSIINNGYAVMYIIAQKLVTKSLKDGYLVGSRGSVGSSFVATMSDITEVNPLPPHYVCPSCKKSEFITDGSIGSGADLDDKNCPNCGTVYKKDGHDIPFEVFLGFEADKEPDIDLNFAGEYQAIAHQYTEELFGKGYVFRAGTIGTIAEKTAYGFVKKYFDKKEQDINQAEVNRLVKGCSGIKRTSGQHPGGIMVVPNYKDIYDFTPIQHPADDSSSGVITTHFDYNSISGRILKLDILGHDVPSIIKMLEDITKVDALGIPLDEPKTMKLFTSTESLGITKEDINSEVGTLGIPEFGTKFVRQMLVDTQPTTFAELVRISGLSHGTDVWINNAQDLVRDGVAKLSEVICTRDDIMLYLIYNGLNKKKSFKIMEDVRKGKGLTEEQENYMRENKIPEWYIESCKKIKYMFPKAHAVAYVTMSFRIAYFKIYHPEAFYATYFTTKAADFDAELIVKGINEVRDKIKELESQGNHVSAKEKNLLTVLEVALEMYARGYKLKKVDLYKSDSDKFLVVDGEILPPLKALEGVGENAARNIVKARADGEFLSVEDLVNRSKVTKTVVEALRVHGCLGNMSESNQLTLFSV